MKYSSLRALGSPASATIAFTACYIALTACYTAPPADSSRPVTVATPIRLAEFRARQQHSDGRFITDSVLQANRTLPLTTVLRSHLLGVGRALDARRVPTTNIDGRCALDVFVNGTRATDPLDAILPGDLAGVEYYDRFSVPGQYRRAGSPCDVLLLWTR